MINVKLNEFTKKKLSFPDQVRYLSEIGIERYYIDLVKMEKTYYSRNDETFVEQIQVENLPALGQNFDKTKVVEAVRATQKGEIDFHTFLRIIIAAGAIAYTVYIDGKHVIYVGRKGESHTEEFHFKL